MRDQYERLPTVALIAWADSVDLGDAAVVWWRLESYRDGARAQFERIQERREKIARRLRKKPTADRDGRPVWSLEQQQIFRDVHYYFICWAQVKAMLEILASRSSFALKISDEHREALNFHEDARDSLEHFGDRLPSSPKKQKLRRKMLTPGDLGNLEGSVFTFGGRRWAVEEEALNTLDTIVASVERQVRAQALDMLRGQRAAERSTETAARRDE